jgi:hypothetical protein
VTPFAISPTPPSVMLPLPLPLPPLLLLVCLRVGAYMGDAIAGRLVCGCAVYSGDTR